MHESYIYIDLNCSMSSRSFFISLFNSSNNFLFSSRYWFNSSNNFLFSFRVALFWAIIILKWYFKSSDETLFVRISLVDGVSVEDEVNFSGKAEFNISVEVEFNSSIKVNASVVFASS